MEAPRDRGVVPSIVSARRNRAAGTCSSGIEHRPVPTAGPCSARERWATPPLLCPVELSGYCEIHIGHVVINTISSRTYV